MAPVLGAPPPPPPAPPHVGPEGFILPRKPYNPCLDSSSHKDLHRELLFNQKMYVSHTRVKTQSLTVDSIFLQRKKCTESKERIAEGTGATPRIGFQEGGRTTPRGVLQE